MCANTHESKLNLQDSDRRLLREGIRSTALALANAAAPVNTYSLDSKTAATMRRLAARIIDGQQKAKEAKLTYGKWLEEKGRTDMERLTEQEWEYFNARRPHCMMRLDGVERLKSELETLDRRVEALRVPDEDDMRHLPLVKPDEDGMGAPSVAVHRQWCTPRLSPARDGADGCAE